jgi:hypothetical protein
MKFNTVEWTDELRKKYYQEHPEKCDCGKEITAQKLGEYGWMFICEDCEISWKA